MLPEFTKFVCRSDDGSEMFHIVVNTNARVIQMRQGEGYIRIDFDQYPTILGAIEAAFEIVEQVIDDERETGESLSHSDQ